MQTISENLKTLLKSKAMVGANAPTARLMLEGVSGGATSPTETMDKISLSSVAMGAYPQYGSGSWVTRPDGKILIGQAYKATSESDAVIRLYVTDEESPLYTENNYIMGLVPILPGITIKGVTDGPKFCIQNGKILMFVADAGVRNTQYKHTFKVYISNDGTGTDFTLLQTLYELDMSSASGGAGATLPEPVILPSGRIILTCRLTQKADNYWTMPLLRVYRSDDTFATFAYSDITTWKYDYSQGTSMRGCAFLSDESELYSFVITDWPGGCYLVYSKDRGETWTQAANGGIASSGNVLYGSYLASPGDGYIYYIRSAYSTMYLTQIFRRPDTSPIPKTIDSLDFDRTSEPWGTCWGEPYYTIAGPKIDERIEWVRFSPLGPILITAAAGNEWYDGGTYATDGWYVFGALRTMQSAEIPLKSVKIDREQSALAQRLSAEIPNVNPADPADVGYYALFRGIDVSADKNAFFDKIKPGTNVVCQMGYGTELTTVFTGAIDDVEISADTGFNIKIECRDSAWKLLDTIVASELGYYILYQNQTIEYMVSDLLQKAGIPSADITTEATGISVVEISFAKCSYADAVEKLLDICGYDLICNELGKFALVKPANPDPLVAAYEFVEGVDIFRMGLKLTRNDIYARVQVTSRIDGVDGAPETYIVKEYVYANASSYGIPTHKTLFVDVSNITDEADLQAMADQIGYEMTRRLITVEFECIPVFQLQVGDIVKVTETSTTISEYYRISSMSMGVDANGKASMSLKCYHYGA